MNAIDSALEVSLNEMLVQGGEDFIYSGVRFRAVISTIELEAPYGTGGYNATQGASVAVLKRDLQGAQPHVGSIITIRGVNYQILKVTDDGPGYTYTAATPSV